MTPRPTAKRPPRSKPRSSPNPPGRPSALHAPAQLANGTTGTVAERVLELLTTGAYVERAARAAGINKGTLYGWLERAALAREALALGRKITPHDAACAAFSNAVEEAEARYEITALTALERIAAGQVRLETITERWEPNADGVLTLAERSVRTHGLAPSAHVIMWKLTRRFPDRYQLATTRDGAGEGPGPAGEPDLTATAVSSMLADLDAFAAEFDNPVG